MELEPVDRKEKQKCKKIKKVFDPMLQLCDQMYYVQVL